MQSHRFFNGRFPLHKLRRKRKKRFFFHHFKPFRIRLYGQNMFNCLKYQHCCALAHVAFWHSKLALTRLKCQQMRNYNAQKPNEKATNETYRNSIVEKCYSIETTVRKRWKEWKNSAQNAHANEKPCQEKWKISCNYSMSVILMPFFPEFWDWQNNNTCQSSSLRYNLFPLSLFFSSFHNFVCTIPF